MGWLFISLSVIVLWIASLCKIFRTTSLHSKTYFLCNDSSGAQKRNALLVIAHPDDESMFFSPTINYLISRGHNLHVMCLSIGDADGMGNVRKHELYKACAVLKVPLQQVKVVDDPNFQVGFGQVWDHNLLGKIIKEEVYKSGTDVVITFDDNYGVSGHCNHGDVHYGVRKLVHENAHGIEAWELASTNILRKYSGPVDIWLSMLLATKKSSTETHCLLNEHPRKSFQAMGAHSSQWVPQAFCFVFKLYVREYT